MRTFRLHADIPPTCGHSAYTRTFRLPADIPSTCGHSAYTRTFRLHADIPPTLHVACTYMRIIRLHVTYVTLAVMTTFITCACQLHASLCLRLRKLGRLHEACATSATTSACNCWNACGVLTLTSHYVYNYFTVTISFTLHLTYIYTCNSIYMYTFIHIHNYSYIHSYIYM